MNAARYYVEHDRVDVVHQTCPYCLGDGLVDAGASAYGTQSARCGFCAGRGYVCTEAPEARARVTV